MLGVIGIASSKVGLFWKFSKIFCYEKCRKL